MSREPAATRATSLPPVPGREVGPSPAVRSPRKAVPKSRTGIVGFDELTGGGLPRERTTAVYGSTGTGKTVFAMQCLVHAARHGEPGVFLSFGESAAEMRENGSSMGLDIAGLEAEGMLVLDSALVDPEEATPQGGHTLDGVFVRLEQAIERIGARHVAIDAINVLAQTLPHRVAARAGLRRLLNGLKRRHITTIVTVEVAEMQDLRAEEFLADCVVFLRHSVVKGIATRSLRVVKYRGSRHRRNEYPFTISSDGITVTPVTAEVLGHASARDRVSVGIPGLDTMLGGGVHRGDTVFVTGSAGSGKTSFTAAIAMAACARGERCLFIALEEPPSQIVRNMEVIGLDLRKAEAEGLLRILSPSPDLEGLEPHLAWVLEEVAAFGAQVVVLDPLTPLMALGEPDDVRETIIRLLGIIKSRGITAACTLLARERYLEEQNTPFASFVDDIILLTNLESDGTRSRALSVLKARGIAHSTQVREFRFTSQGVEVGGTHGGGPPGNATPEDDP
jgi:circadian clock protein KaiC